MVDILSQIFYYLLPSLRGNDSVLQQFGYKCISRKDEPMLEKTTLWSVFFVTFLGGTASAGMIYPSGGRMAFEKIESSEFSPSESATDFDTDFVRNIFQTIVRPRPRAISVVSANLYEFAEDGFRGYTTTAATAHGGPNIFAKATADLLVQFMFEQETLVSLSGRYVLFYNNETSMNLTEDGNPIFTLPSGPGYLDDTFAIEFPAVPGALYELSIWSMSSDIDPMINSFGAYVELEVVCVPEPPTKALLLMGLTVLLFVARRVHQ